MMWSNIPYIIMFSIGQKKNHPCTYTNDFKGIILVTLKNTNTVQINHVSNNVDDISHAKIML